MAELKVSQPDAYRDVKEFEFILTSGVPFTVAIDEAAGDTMELLGENFLINLKPKDNALSEEPLPAETFVIFRDKLAAVVERTRRMRVPSPDERFALRQMIQRAANQSQEE